MTNKELIDALAEQTGLAKTQSKEVLNALASVVTDALKNGDKVTIPGLGTLRPAVNAAREGRNPATGEAMHISASNTARFKVSKTLKDTLN